jgi:hypothetical protein
MKKLVIVVLFFAGFCAQAQKVSIEGVRYASLRQSEAIKEGTEVKGYYFFYVSDKIDKKTNEYTLRIMDDNLKVLKDIKFTDSKYVSILESSFNGTDLIFLFHNSDDRTFEYQVYGADGKKKFVYNRQLTKKEERFLERSYSLNDEEQTYKGLYPIDGKGFISNTPSTEDKDFTFQVDFFSTEKKKQWTWIPTEGGKRFVGDYLGTNNGVVYFEVLKYRSNMDQNPESFIVGLSLETGKQLFENSTDKGKYKFYPASMAVLYDGKSYLFGEYFNPNANIMKDKSLGFAFLGVDEKGTIFKEKYNSWDLELGKYLPVSSKGKIDDFGYMYLHNMVQTTDGSLYAVGEGYKKVASALGIINTIASGGQSTVSVAKLKITDIIMIKFDKDFNVKDAKIYEKNDNNFELPAGSLYTSAAWIGKMIKAWGGFDYNYTQVNKDNTAFTVTYSDYVRGKDYKGSTFNAISYNEGKVSTDQINTKTKANVSWVLPAKQGQVLLVDYYRKDKRLEAHFEKLN